MKSAGSFKENAAIKTLVGVQKRYSSDGGGFLAAILSYYGFLSLFPLILVVVSVLGFFLAGDSAYQARLSLRIAEAVPGLSEAVGKNINAVVNKRTSLGALGFAALVWTGIGAVEAARFTLGRVFRVEENLSFLKKKGSALLSLATIGTAALISVGLATIMGGIRAQGAAGFALKAAVIAGTFVLDFWVFITAYRTLTPKRGPKFRDLWTGALLAASGWTALKVFGGWYIRRSVDGATASFGTFATVVGLLALLYLVARLFVYGAELNAFRMEKAGNLPPPRKKVKDGGIAAPTWGRLDPEGRDRPGPSSKEGNMSAIEKSIDVDVPVSTVYNQWTQFEEFPKFMGGVESVEQVSDSRVRWLAEIGGQRRQWEAQITRQEPDRLIAWESIEGAKNNGLVRFEPGDEGKTRVTLIFDFDPEGFVEKAGDKLGAVENQVEMDLKRFKELIEATKVESGAWRGTIG